ncbi:MAG: hypothetical protein JNM98_06205 [Rhodocyclaceae bacterium]|nr:hypothetical protein [Rhodocyclaceae bacterium]
MADYENGSQQRLCQVIRALAGNEFGGVAPSEIARAVRATPSAITRDLANLAEAGFAEKIEQTGRWRLGPTVVQIATAFTTHLADAERRLTEINQRYTRIPN